LNKIELNLTLTYTHAHPHGQLNYFDGPKSEGLCNDGQGGPWLKLIWGL